ncbi:hypothetical protein MHYP_G00313380 [Metynnis hypsauchen]
MKLPHHFVEEVALKLVLRRGNEAQPGSTRLLSALILTHTPLPEPRNAVSRASLTLRQPRVVSHEEAESLRI